MSDLGQKGFVAYFINRNKLFATRCVQVHLSEICQQTGFAVLKDVHPTNI